MTATTGKTVLAIIATLSLVLSFFAIARPAIATHGGEHLNPDHVGTSWDDEEQNAKCPAEDLAKITEGQVLWHFVLTSPSSDEAQLTIEFENDGVIGPFADADHPSETLHWWIIRDGPDTLKNAWTDISGGNLNLSHICNKVEDEDVDGSLTILKTDDNEQTPTPLSATFQVTGPNGYDETFATDATTGEVCIDELAPGEYTVTETIPPTGYELANPASQMHTVAIDDGCESADAAADVTFRNTLTEELDGELEVDKFNCTGEDDDTVFFVSGPFSALTEPDTSECTIGAGVTFSVYTDAGGGVAGDFVLEDTTDAAGIIEVPLPAGDYVLVEGAEGEEGPSKAFTIESGAVTAIVVLNIEGDDDEGEVKILKFVCPGEEDAVVFYQEGDPTIPNLENCEVGDATFTIDGGEAFTTENGGALKTVAADVEHTLAETLPNQGSTTFTVGDGDRVTIIVINTEGETEPDTGSITVVKEVDCDACETRTIGYYFNTADQHEEETNALFDALGGIWADGILFTNVDQVQQYRADDTDGTSDGQNGLSARGQLTLQYLAAALNVERNGEDCDLASRVYNNADSPFDGWTVGDILAEADAAFAGTSAYSDEDIKSALDDINNSSHEDENPLTCEGSESGTLDGVKFDLFLEADYPEGDPIDSGTTGEDGPGTVTFDGLALDETYVLVESGFPEGMTCEIVDVKGEGFEFTLNEDGSVTIVLTANAADVTLTVVNECEEGEEEEEFGEIEIRKSAADDPEESFAFSATWDTDGFTLMDGDAEFSGDLPAGEEFTVTEELTAEQILAGWSLADIDCGEADVTVEGSSVTITVVADAVITCTFTNELEEEDEEEGELEIIKFFCPTVGEDQIFVYGPLAEEPVEFGVQGLEENDELPSEDGCTLGAPSEEALGATFTITGGDLTEPLVVSTTWNEILTLDLAPGDYTIVEEGTQLTADFTIADESDTAVVVFNFEEEEEAEEGRLKILKIYCVGQGDPVFTVVDGDATVGDVDLPDGCENPQPGDATFTLTTGETTSGEFTLGDDGARLIPLTVGTYVLNEVDPNEASSDAFDVSVDETTTVIVFNFAAEGEQPGGEGPGQNETPREGTQGGNPLPNTATSPIPTGSVPAALLALLMLVGLGGAGYAVHAEARRRR